MGRAPCCDKANVKKGPWSPEEDAKLKSYIEKSGTGGNWIALPQKIGLKRCGKSCRLRWLNYLRPNIKHGSFSEEEENIICTLYCSIGSRWSVIAGQLPGRTDNDIKNYWNTKLKKKLLQSKQQYCSENKPTNISSSCLIKQEDNSTKIIKECDSRTTILSTDDDVTFYQPMITSSQEEYYYLRDTIISSNFIQQQQSDEILPNTSNCGVQMNYCGGFQNNNFGPHEFQEEEMMGYNNNLWKWNDGVLLSENIRAFPQLITSYEDINNSQVVCYPTFSEYQICQNSAIQLLPDCPPQEPRPFGMQQQPSIVN